MCRSVAPRLAGASKAAASSRERHRQSSRKTLPPAWSPMLGRLANQDNYKNHVPLRRLYNFTHMASLQALSTCGSSFHVFRWNALLPKCSCSLCTLVSARARRERVQRSPRGGIPCLGQIGLMQNCPPTTLCDYLRTGWPNNPRPVTIFLCGQAS